MCGYFKSSSSLTEVTRKGEQGEAGQQHKGEQNGVLYRSLSQKFVSFYEWCLHPRAWDRVKEGDQTAARYAR